MQTKILRIVGFISTAMFSAAIIVAIAFRFLDSPKEKIIRDNLAEMEDRYRLMQDQLRHMDEQITQLEDRDNNVYRSIFETAPLPDSIRNGKSEKEIENHDFAYHETDELIATLTMQTSTLKHRIEVQQRSYDTLQKLVMNKEKMLASIPAIQPISNKNLEHIASGFGYRIDPIYKTPKMHTGLDFAASIGTPIYATANGIVSNCSYDDGGYGNNIIVNHGYGYATLYGHMVRIKARVGEVVKRGQILGYVGSTGKSTGPHLHYEVIRNGKKIDPVHYFFHDLNAADYERMIHIAAASNQSFD